VRSGTIRVLASTVMSDRALKHATSSLRACFRKNLCLYVCGSTSASRSAWLCGVLKSSSNAAAFRRNYANASTTRSLVKRDAARNSASKAICAKYRGKLDTTAELDSDSGTIRTPDAEFLRVKVFALLRPRSTLEPANRSCASTPARDRCSHVRSMVLRMAR